VTQSQFEEAVEKMTPEELLRGIEKNLALANDLELQLARSAYATIIEAFTRELANRSKQQGKGKTRYS